MNLSDYLRRTLKEENLTVAAVEARAARHGGRISRSYISELVQGYNSNLSLATIRALALGLRRPPQELLEAAGFQFGATAKDVTIVEQNASSAEREVYIALLESSRLSDLAVNYELLSVEDKQEIEQRLAQLEGWIKSRLPPA